MRSGKYSGARPTRMRTAAFNIFQSSPKNEILRHRLWWRSFCSRHSKFSCKVAASVGRGEGGHRQSAREPSGAAKGPAWHGHRPLVGESTPPSRAPRYGCREFVEALMDDRTKVAVAPGVPCFRPCSHPFTAGSCICFARSSPVALACWCFTAPELSSPRSMAGKWLAMVRPRKCHALTLCTYDLSTYESWSARVASYACAELYISSGLGLQACEENFVLSSDLSHIKDLKQLMRRGRCGVAKFAVKQSHLGTEFLPGSRHRRIF